MRDVNLGPPPSRSSLPALLLAAGVLAATAGAVFLLNPRKTADLVVTNSRVYAARVQMDATPTTDLANGTRVVGTTASIDRDLYVLVQMKLTDELRLPLFIDGETLTLTAPDDSILTASAMPPDQVASVYGSFPALKAIASASLPHDAQAAPKSSVEGTVLFHFNGLSEVEWNARKTATLTVRLAHQAPQVTTVPKS